MELRAADFTSMRQMLDALLIIRDIQISLEASDVPNFMLVGRQIVQLLYVQDSLNSAVGITGRFVKAFKDKLAASLDDTALFLEWGLAALLDPR